MLIKLTFVVAAVLLLCGTARTASLHKPFLKPYVDTDYLQKIRNVRQATTFAFAKIFQDHMVLQKEPARANIYGFSSSIGQTVNATLKTPSQTYTYSVKVENGSNPNTGYWIVELDDQAADTPANITVTSQGTTLKLTDVIFGDVWICSGQSNMQFGVNQMLDADDERKDVNYPKIRIMTVADQESVKPVNDIIQIGQAWTAPSSDAIAGFSAVCWVYGKNIHKALGYSIGLIHTSWGGTPAESWSSPAALAKCGNTLRMPAPPAKSLLNPASQSSAAEERLLFRNPTDNSVLWNAMIYPLLKTTIKGAIWYQGESDAGGVKQDHYNCTFPTMINDWRQNWAKASNGQTDSSFPFGFVQLAPYNNEPNNEWGFTDIRWHQTADKGFVPNPAMPNTFMAVAIDLPDFDAPTGSIHPRDKKDVGDRLSLAGLAVAYKKAEVYQGPFPSKTEVNSNGVKVTYGSSVQLEIRNTTGFELLCSGRWSHANITTHDTTSVTLQNVCGTASVQQIRYAWRLSPCSFKMCAIYEKINGLPGPPFILNVGA